MSSDLHADSDELDPDEPQTPMWLPLLGGALFLALLMLFLATQNNDEPSTQSTSVEAVAAADPDTGRAPQPGAALPGAALPPGAARPSAARPAGAAQPASAALPGAAPGQMDAHQRSPGDEHYGHDHP